MKSEEIKAALMNILFKARAPHIRFVYSPEKVNTRLWDMIDVITFKKAKNNNHMESEKKYKDFILEKFQKDIQNPFALRDDIFNAYEMNFKGTPIVKDLVNAINAIQIDEVPMAGFEQTPLILSVENTTDRSIVVDLLSKPAPGIIIEHLDKTTSGSVIDYNALLSNTAEWRYVVSKVKMSSESLVNVPTVIYVHQIVVLYNGDSVNKGFALVPEIGIDQVDPTFATIQCDFIIAKNVGEQSSITATLLSKTKVVFHLFPKAKLKNI